MLVYNENDGITIEPRIVGQLDRVKYVRILMRKVLRHYKAKTTDGTIFLFRSEGQDMDTIRNVFVHDVYELKSYVKKDDCILDVGAHIGAFALLSSKLVGDGGLVLSFEPSKSNFSLLSKNLSINKRSNVRICNVAVGDVEGWSVLRIYNRHGGNSFYARNDLKMVGLERVRVTTVDNILMFNGIKKCDFAKIDVEGHELKVLEGMRKTLAKYHPRLHIETHFFGPNTDRIVSFLKEYDYHCEVKRKSMRFQLIFAV
ncbi:MAG: FkbM family methyltransferase [Conexivisphaerales archaeon]